jgi:hypothetical protein
VNAARRSPLGHDAPDMKQTAAMIYTNVKAGSLSHHSDEGEALIGTTVVAVKGEELHAQGVTTPGIAFPIHHRKRAWQGPELRCGDHEFLRWCRRAAQFDAPLPRRRIHDGDHALGVGNCACRPVDEALHVDFRAGRSAPSCVAGEAFVAKAEPAPSASAAVAQIAAIMDTRFNKRFFDLLVNMLFSLPAAAKSRVDKDRVGRRWLSQMFATSALPPVAPRTTEVTPALQLPFSLDSPITISGSEKGGTA